MTVSEQRTRPLIDRLEEVAEQGVETSCDPDQRDTEFIRTILPGLRTWLRWFDASVEGFEHLPDTGPMLLVGNHSGGVHMPDYWAFLSEWIRQRGVDAPLHSLGFDLVFSIPGAGTLARKMGTLPASHEMADELLDRGATVLVYPGGDADDFRPWTERHRVDLHGHTGFVRLALRHGVPVVPIVSHGSHDAIIVLARGDELARSLGLDRLRIGVMPVVLGPLGLLTPPMPAKVVTRICEPFDWSDLGPEAAEDGEVVRHCYEQVLGRMQACLDDLVAEVPHPVRARIATALGLDRLHRAVRSG
jgi:1-acyl-sn-glycerol-3-phosphate acyltransferase